MKNITLSAFVAAAALGVASAACSSAPAERTDADSTLASFKNPTGSFSKENAGSAFSGYKSEQGESGKVQAPGVSGGTSNTQSMKLLARTLDAKSQCTEGQTCACPTSGSFVYGIEQSKSGQSLRATFDSCIDESGSGFNGEVLFLATSRPLLGIALKAPAKSKLVGPGGAKQPTTPAPSGGGATGGGLQEANPGSSSGAQASAENYLFVAKGTAIEGRQSTPIEFAVVSEAGYLVASVSVPDGNVIVGMAPDQTIFVQAKQGSWVCTPNGSRYTCKGDGQVEDLELDDASTATASNSDAPSAGSSSGGGSGSPSGGGSEPDGDFDF
jgi:hypothetical protein